MEAVISFTDYYISSADIKIKKLDLNVKRSLGININHSIDIMKKEENAPFKGKVTLVCNIEDEGVLKLNVSITGIFTSNSDITEERFIDMCNVNGAAILFPFLRGAVADISRTCNIQPIIIPVINVVNMLKQRKEAKKENTPQV